jgi:hypothetical protein
MVATFSIQNFPNYRSCQGGQLTENTWNYEKVINCALSLVQTYSSECRDKWSIWKAGRWICQRIGTLIPQSVATRKLQCVVHTYGERTVFEWTRGSPASEWSFQLVHNKIQNYTYDHSIQSHNPSIIVLPPALHPSSSEGIFICKLTSWDCSW